MEEVKGSNPFRSTIPLFPRFALGSGSSTTLNMHIGRFGFVEDESAAAWARREFSRQECLALPEFLAPDLAGRFTHALDLEGCSPAVHYFGDHEEFGRDLSFAPTSPTLHALHLLLNNPRLFSAISGITGCGPIGCFSGRLYRNLPAPEYHLDWHDDTQSPGRLIGLSVSFTPGAVKGGEFRLRRKSTHEILAEIPQSGPGNAHIFRIDAGLEHCVAPVGGDMPRTAFAGWFLSGPDCRTFVQSLFGGQLKG